MIGRLHWASLWGVFGYLFLLSQALYRLTPMALEPIMDGMAAWQWALWAGYVAFMIYSEGYRGFVKQVAPRVAGRAMALADSTNNASLVRRLLAPLFCMSLFGASRRRLIISYCLYSGIIVVVIAVRQVAQPYRGIIDAGVVLGLGLGVLAVLYYFAVALSGRALPVPTDIPDQEHQGE